MYDKNYFECCNRFRKIYIVSKDILKPLLKTPKASLLYVLNKNWENIISTKYFKYTKIEKINLLKENKVANLYIISYNSSTSFYINNSKSIILDKINNYFGYRAIINLYLKEIPKIIDDEIIRKEIVLDKKKITEFIDNNKLTNDILKNKINDLAIEVYTKKI